MKLVHGNLTVSPFSNSKELIFQNRCKTKTKPYFLSPLLFQSVKLQKCIAQESSKEGLHPECQAFSQWMTSTLWTQRLWILHWSGFISRVQKDPVVHTYLFLKKLSLLHPVFHRIILKKYLNCCFNLKKMNSPHEKC